MRALAKRPAVLVNDHRVRCEFADIETSWPTIDTYEGVVPMWPPLTVVRLEMRPVEWAHWVMRDGGLVRWMVGLRDPDRTWIYGRGLVRFDASAGRIRTYIRATIECHEQITLEVRRRGR